MFKIKKEFLSFFKWNLSSIFFFCLFERMQFSFFFFNNIKLIFKNGWDVKVGGKWKKVFKLRNIQSFLRNILN